jgi:hypothetical protein
MELLLKKRKITSIEVIQKTGNTRLSATIYNLRNKYNLNISTNYKVVLNRKGKKSRVGVYKLEEPMFENRSISYDNN